MMRFTLMVTILLGLELSADYVKETAAVCADEATVIELAKRAKAQNVKRDGVEMELWLMSHDCKVIDKKTPIEVLDYTGTEKKIVKIRLKKSNEIVYAHSKAIQIEQPGQKNIIHKF